MAANPRVHVHKASPQQRQLLLRNTLTFRHPPKSQRFGFSVMEHWPAIVHTEVAIETLPAALFTMFSQHQQGLIASSVHVPGSVGSHGETPETMKEIVAGIRV